MTTADLEQCLRTEGPYLKKRLVHSDIDEQVYQRTMIALWQKIDRVTWTDQSAFHNLFESYFKMWRFDQRTKAARLSKVFTEVAWSDVIDHYNNLTCDPWNTHRVQAEEYIAMVTSEKTRRLLYLYYIEGYNLIEIGRLVGLSKTNVDKYIKQGIAQIQCRVQEL